MNGTFVNTKIQQLLKNATKTNNSNTNPKNNKICKDIQMLQSHLETTCNSDALYQQAIYFQLGQYGNLAHLGYNKSYCPIFGVYSLITGGADQLRKMVLSISKVITQKVQKRGIVLVFFCGFVEKIKRKNSKTINFGEFKEHVLKALSLKYIGFIQNVYVCHQGFFSKLSPFSNSNIHHQIVNSLVTYCSNLQELVQELGPLFQCELIKEQVQSYNSSGNWLDLYSPNDKKQAKRIMLEVFKTQPKQNMPYKKCLSDYEKQSQKGIPNLFMCLISALKQNQVYLKSQGIFRKACNQQRLHKLETQLSLCESMVQKTQVCRKYDGDTIACCMKKLLCHLTPPLVSFQIYSSLLKKLNKVTNQQNTHRETLPTSKPADPNAEQNIQLLINLLQEMDESSKQILQYLIDFLHCQILKNEKFNKMSAYNLSVVISSCIFRPQNYIYDDLSNSSKIVAILAEAINDPKLLKVNK